MDFDVIGDITGSQTIVAASSIRERGRSRRSTSSLDVLIGAGAGVRAGSSILGLDSSEQKTLTPPLQQSKAPEVPSLRVVSSVRAFRTLRS